MKILVCPIHLGIGGSQINAIDLAAGTAASGHDVIIYGPPGPLVDYIHSKGLRYVPAPASTAAWGTRLRRYLPAPTRMARIARLVRSEAIDLVHSYEYPRCLDAYYGAHLVGRVPLLCTSMSMTLSPLVPPSIPLVVGTADLGEAAARTHCAPVWVVEPPVDVDSDHPGLDGSSFRARHGVGDNELLVVTVSRLSEDIKLDPLERAMDAVGSLAKRYPLRLVVVGDGHLREQLAERAETINRRIGRSTILVPGPELHPRPAYAAADIVVGMGGSALRGMAVGKPLVVQGERGFSEILEPRTMPIFLKQGFFGSGDGAPVADRLIRQLDALLADPARRLELGRFGRTVAVERFSLQRGTDLHLTYYEHICSMPRTRDLAEGAMVAGRALRLELARFNPGRVRTRTRLRRERHDAARRPRSDDPGEGPGSGRPTASSTAATEFEAEVVRLHEERETRWS